MARVDLNPVEEARACAMLVDDLGLTKQEVGRRVGRSRVAISNLVRLLDLPGGGARADRDGRAERGPRPRDPALQGPRDAAPARAATPATAAGRCARPSARAREAEGQPEPEQKRFRREVHPDLAEALAAAEDTLSTAFGRPVKVRARGDGCRVELDFDTPGEAVELAERILSRTHLRAV